MSNTYYEVYGLEDFQPYALACKACTDHVLSVVHGAYSVPEPAAPHDCELFYDGVCLDYQQSQNQRNN